MAVLIGAVLLSEISLAILFLLLAAIGTNEYFQLVQKHNTVQVPVLLGLFLSIAVYIVLVADVLVEIHSVVYWLLFPLLTLVSVYELFQNQESPFSNIAHTLLPVFYIAIPFALLVRFPLLSGEYEMSWVLTYFFLQWSNDTGAYLGGKAMGKRKLFERVSPNKTWEGTVSGVILTIVVAIICSYSFEEISTVASVGMAVIVGSFGSIGDLVQSILKRSVGAKDSGNIMPGHGGVLDRFDGVLIAMPWIYFWIFLIQSI